MADTQTLPTHGRRPRVVAVAVTARRRRQVLSMLRAVVAQGGEAVLVTADGRRGDTPAEGVLHIDLGADERHFPAHLPLMVDPRRVLARAGIGARPVGAPPLWRRWSQSRPYAAVRYWLLWRLLAKHVDQLRPADVTHVIIVGIESWPITWHIVRGRTDVTIGFDLPPELRGGVDQ